MERFLQLAADENIQVCNVTTPAQYFHLLRRQMKRDFRKPLVLMTPKSLLRHKDAVSPVNEFTDGRFQEILDDPAAEPDRVRRVVMCSGKLYYDLAHARQERNPTTWPSCALSSFTRSPRNVSGKCWADTAGPGIGLGTRRTTEHGRLVLYGRAVARHRL